MVTRKCVGVYKRLNEIYFYLKKNQSIKVLCEKLFIKKLIINIYKKII